MIRRGSWTPPSGAPVDWIMVDLLPWDRFLEGVITRAGVYALPSYANSIEEWGVMYRTGVDPGDLPLTDVPRDLRASGSVPGDTDLDVTGSSVDIGEYLHRSPECMVSEEVPPMDLPLTRIVVDTGVSAMISAQTLRMCAEGIARACRSLEALGRAVAVDTVDVTYVRPTEVVTCLHVPVKGPDGPIDLRRMIWACGHPNFNRDTVFAYLASLHGMGKNWLTAEKGLGVGMVHPFLRSIVGGSPVIITMEALAAASADPASMVLMACMGDAA